MSTTNEREAADRRIFVAEEKLRDVNLLERLTQLVIGLERGRARTRQSDARKIYDMLTEEVCRHRYGYNIHDLHGRIADKLQELQGRVYVLR